MVFKQILVVVTLCIPPPSNQHFIWPLDVCLLADICNHTWIPECGRDRMSKPEYRRFTDECDFYEYNCDYGTNYAIVNYSDCFKSYGGCPTVQCPSHPPCKNHLRDYTTESTPLLPPHSLPAHMLRGQRRYTPIPLYRKTKIKAKAKATTTTAEKKCTKQTQPLRKTTLSKPKQRKNNGKNLVILKKEVMMRNGRRLTRVVWGTPKTTKAMKVDSDFLEG